MKISIIIPTFNRCQILSRLLDFLSHDTQSISSVDYEVIVVDDCSTDNTWEVVSNNFPNVKLIRGAGKNAELAKRFAIEESVGDYVVNLDDDSMPAYGWLASVRPALERGEQIVQGKIVFVDLGEKNLQDERTKKTFRTGFRFDMMPVSILYGGYRPQYLNNCHEFGCFISRDVLARVPLDDHNLIFHHLGESASFYLRATKAGYRVWFEPSVIIEHLGATTGGCVERSKKESPKRNCTPFAIGMVHNFMILARMYQPLRIPLLIPYYLLGGLYLSFKQRKNCLKYFVKGLYSGLTKPFSAPLTYNFEYNSAEVLSRKS